MSLVTRTPLALEISHRDLTNRVGLGHVWKAYIVTTNLLRHCSD